MGKNPCQRLSGLQLVTVPNICASHQDQFARVNKVHRRSRCLLLPRGVSTRETVTYESATAATEEQNGARARANQSVSVQVQ